MVAAYNKAALGLRSAVIEVGIVAAMATVALATAMPALG
jgi:hypothetical protein